MNIILINSMNFGSTGTICNNLVQHIKKYKNTAVLCVPHSRSNAAIKNSSVVYIGNRFTRNIHLVLGTVTGLQGFFSYFSTLRFLRKIKDCHPDIIHLHNLHNCYINIPLLFRYLKKNNIPTVWTLHDCCSFTGKCPHFLLAQCDKWKTGCYNCPQLNRYPQSILDATWIQWHFKKKWFTDLDSMTIVTPSEWLSALVKVSFLKQYQVKVIHNGINLEVFKRTCGQFRKIIDEKYVILGVSMTWGYSKGLDIFLKLSQTLGDDYRIVLVGIDGSELTEVPSNITIIKKTRNQQALADLYSSADVFLNPTREDNFPTVNIEALACGTPVITFQTGGSSEIVDETCGVVIKADDFSTLQHKVIWVCTEHPFAISSCEKRAKVFNNENFCDKYEILYEEILNGNKKG